MEAILIVNASVNTDDAGEIRTEALPVYLMPLVDRPFLQHTIERLVDIGADRITFVLGPGSDSIRKTFPSGTRWGVKFQFVQVPDDNLLYSVAVKSAGVNSTTPVLIACADRLPDIKAASVSIPLEEGKCVLFDTKNETGWTGWALVTGSLLQSLPATASNEEIEALLRSNSAEGAPELCATLDASNYSELLQSQDTALAGGFPGLISTGREIKPGIRLSRNAAVNPTAVLTGNVFIGENSRIGAGVQLGPNVVIGNDCVIEADTVVSNSLVLSGTYLGEGLELKHVIADRAQILSVIHNAAVVVPDTFIAGSLRTSLFSRLLQRTRGGS